MKYSSVCSFSDVKLQVVGCFVCGIHSGLRLVLFLTRLVVSSNQLVSHTYFIRQMETASDFVPLQNIQSQFAVSASGRMNTPLVWTNWWQEVRSGLNLDRKCVVAVRLRWIDGHSDDGAAHWVTDPDKHSLLVESTTDGQQALASLA